MNTTHNAAATYFELMRQATDELAQLQDNGPEGDRVEFDLAGACCVVELFDGCYSVSIPEAFPSAEYFDTWSDAAAYLVEHAPLAA